MSRPNAKPPHAWRRFGPSSAPWIALALTLLFVLAIRLRLRDVPLERDEGEYAYAGQLLLQGIPPYQLAYTMKLPGTPAIYAAIMALLGETTTAIHLGLLAANAVTILLVFLVGRKLFDTAAGIAAAISYALLSASPSVLGLAAHATHFVVLFALAGIWVLLRTLEKETRFAAQDGSKGVVSAWPALLASGVFFGLAFLMKQHGVTFGWFGLACLVCGDRCLGRRAAKPCLARAAVFCAGLALPLLVTCIALWRAGVFDQFIYWTVKQAAGYAGATSLADGGYALAAAVAGVAGPNLWLWLLALGGLGLLFINRDFRRQRFFLLGFLIASGLAICPGFYFRPHYFIMILPAVAWLIGGAMTSGGRLLARRGKLLSAGLPFGLFALAAGMAVSQNSDVWLRLTPLHVCRLLYGVEPFPESLPIADYVQQHTTPGDRIAVLGSEPQIYFYTRRHSATGHIYMYPLMDPTPGAAAMQASLIREIEEARPAYIVYVRSPIIWMRQTNSPTAIFTWADDYLAKNYSLEGVADELGPTRTEYRWGAAASQYKPGSEFYTEIYKRNAR